MLALKLSIGVILTLALFNLSNGQELTHDERCTIREGNGVRVDECDAKRLLTCKDGRCQCPDPATQIYTYRLEPVAPSRSRRSPGKKGGGFKKIAAGAVAGVATYQVAKAAGKAVNNGFTTTPKPPKYNKIYSCYTRVGGQCALNYNNVETVSGDATTTTTTTTTTTVAPATNETASDSPTTTPAPSSSSTEAAPVAAAQTKVDLSKIPKCVQFAVCKPNTPASNSTGFLQKVDFDPRIGLCECAEGYKKTTRDICEKVSSGAGKTVGTSAMLVILSSLILNKIFV